MTDDQLKLLEALEERYGKRIQYYAGNVYLDGQKFNMDKLERDYLAWCARSTVPVVSNPSPA